MPRRRAHTLIEILIASSILATLFLMIHRIGSYVRRTYHVVDRRCAEQADAVVALRHIVNELSTASRPIAPREFIDGSPATRPFLVYRNEEAEYVWLTFDRDTGSVIKTRLEWDLPGNTLRPVRTELTPPSPTTEEVLFTVVAKSRGWNIRVAVRTTNDWYFDAITKWSPHWNVHMTRERS